MNNPILTSLCIPRVELLEQRIQRPSAVVGRQVVTRHLHLGLCGIAAPQAAETFRHNDEKVPQGLSNLVTIVARLLLRWMAQEPAAIMGGKEMHIRAESKVWSNALDMCSRDERTLQRL